MSRFTVFLVLISMVTLNKPSFAQCTPLYRFQTQLELNDFFEDNESCDTLLGGLKLERYSNTPDSLAIKDLSPLKNLKVINGNLVIRNLGGIITLDSLASLEYILGGVAIYNCSNLSSIDKVLQVPFGPSIHLGSLPKLQQVLPFSVDSLGFVALSQLPISDLSFLSTVEYIDYLSIDNCDSILNLIEIESISLTSAKVINCDYLSQCAVESICNIVSEDVTNLTIYNNLGDCNTVEQVAMACIPDSAFCLRDAFYITNQTDLNFLSIYPDDCIDSIIKITIAEGDPSDPIVDLTPLNRFVSLEFLVISHTSTLENLVGLENFESIDKLIISKNKMLRSTFGLSPSLVTTLLDLESNPVLEDLPQFTETGSLEEIKIFNQNEIHPLEYQKLISIKTIDIFGSQVGSKSFIEDNEELRSLKLDAVKGFNSLNFSTSTPGFQSLDIFNCKDLNSITNINFQDTVDLFSIRVNSLTEFSVSNAGHHFNSITISEPLLEEIDFFPISVNYISMYENDSLKEIDFLDSLSYLQRFYISDNDLLHSIGTTSNLHTDVDEIYIYDNPELEVIDAFDNDIIAEEIRIVNNVKLEDCGVEIICNKYKEGTYALMLHNNSPGCSKDSITILCPNIKNPLFSVEINNQKDIDDLARLYPEMDSIFGSLNIGRDNTVGSQILDFSFFRQLKYIKSTLSIINFGQSHKFDGSVFDSCYYSSLDIRNVYMDSFPIYHGADTLENLVYRGYPISSFESEFNDLKVITNTLEIYTSDYDNSLNHRFTDLEYVTVLELYGLQFRKDNFPKLKGVKELDLTKQTFTDLDFVSTIDIETKLTVKNSYNFDYLSLKDLDNQNLQSITIWNCDSLKMIEGFNEVINCTTSFNFSFNDKLKNINILNKAKTISSLSLTRNNLLDSLYFPRIREAGSLTIDRNDLLQYIAFDSLESSSLLKLDKNPILKDVSQIPSSADITNLTITNNIKLEDCNLDLVCNNLAKQNYVDVRNNLGICAFEASIQSNCGITSGFSCLSGGLTFRSVSTIQNYIQYYDDCEIIDGSLIIDVEDSSEIDTIVFKGIREIKGHLIINNSNAKHIIFENLNSIGGYFKVTDDLLESLKIKHLENSRGISVQNCQNLKYIDFNDGTETELIGHGEASSDFGFTIKNNESLKEIRLGRVLSFVTINITNNPNLEILDGIIEGENYTYVKCVDNNALKIGLVFRASDISGSLELINLNSLQKIKFEEEVSAPIIIFSDLQTLDTLDLLIPYNEVSHLKISNNQNLKSIIGLQNVAVKNHIEIINNSSIETLDFLSTNISTARLTVNNNDSLKDIELNFGLDTVAHITVSDNENLLSISGLDSTYVSSSLIIERNPKIKKIDVFKENTTINSIFFAWNDSLEYLNIEHVGNHPDFVLILHHLENLKKLDGFDFTNMKALKIEENPKLAEINFENDSTIITNITVLRNPLYTGCINPVFCNNFVLGNNITVSLNGQGCGGAALMFSSCFTNTEEINSSKSTMIYPNPTTGILHYTSNEKIEEIELYTLNGRKLTVNKTNDSIDLSHFNRGGYILKVIYKDKMEAFKIIKL